MAQDFKLFYTAFGEHVLRAEWMKAEMLKRGERVKELAVSIAPDYPPIGVGYKESFEVDVDVRATGRGGVRACATVRNTSDHAAYVEFGGQETPAHRVLGKALGAAR